MAGQLQRCASERMRASSRAAAQIRRAGAGDRPRRHHHLEHDIGHDQPAEIRRGQPSPTGLRPRAERRIRRHAGRRQLAVIQSDGLAGGAGFRLLDPSAQWRAGELPRGTGNSADRYARDCAGGLALPQPRLGESGARGAIPHQRQQSAQSADVSAIHADRLSRD